MEQATWQDTALLRAPPKAVFQLLSDPSFLEEISSWRVDAQRDMQSGDTWTERRFLSRRRWTVAEYDRRGFHYTLDGPVTLRVACKKGGTGSCNVQLKATGTPGAVRKFEKTDGDRLARLVAWFDGPDDPK